MPAAKAGLLAALTQPIVTKYYMMLLVLFLGAGFVLLLSARFKHPIALLKRMYYNLKGVPCIPVVKITSNNSLVVDVVPKELFTSSSVKGTYESHLYKGHTVNIAGLGQGYVIFEESFLPVNVTAQALRERLKEEAEEHRVHYSMLDAQVIGGTIAAFANMAMMSVTQKMRGRQQMLQYAVLGGVVIVLGLVALLYTQNKSIITALQHILQSAPVAAGGGTEYGIKP